MIRARGHNLAPEQKCPYIGGVIRGTFLLGYYVTFGVYRFWRDYICGENIPID